MPHMPKPVFIGIILEDTIAIYKPEIDTLIAITEHTTALHWEKFATFTYSQPQTGTFIA